MAQPIWEFERDDEDLLKARKARKLKKQQEPKPPHLEVYNPSSYMQPHFRCEICGEQYHLRSQDVNLMRLFKLGENIFGDDPNMWPTVCKGCTWMIIHHPDEAEAMVIYSHRNMKEIERQEYIEWYKNVFERARIIFRNYIKQYRNYELPKID